MTFRYARHTTNLNRLKEFYTKVIGLGVIGHFENHNNYNGIFLGLKNENWHLEFTTSSDAPSHITDDDDALVFYYDSLHEINERLEIAKSLRIKQVNPKNPYWNSNSISLLDPDGFRVILCLKKH